MNEVSVNVFASPKPEGSDEASVSQSDVDPLAFDDTDATKEKDPLEEVWMKAEESNGKEEAEVSVTLAKPKSSTTGDLEDSKLDENKDLVEKTNESTQIQVDETLPITKKLDPEKIEAIETSDPTATLVDTAKIHEKVEPQAAEISSIKKLEALTQLSTNLDNERDSKNTDSVKMIDLPRIEFKAPIVKDTSSVNISKDDPSNVKNLVVKDFSLKPLTITEDCKSKNTTKMDNETLSHIEENLGITSNPLKKELNDNPHKILIKTLTEEKPVADKKDVERKIEKEDVVMREIETNLYDGGRISKSLTPEMNETVKNGKINGDCSKEDGSRKRPSSADDIEESPFKKLMLEMDKSFPQHDKMINDFISSTTKNNIDDIQKHTEQLLTEIQTLREVAQRKELEWNNVLHLKKVKEEILLRLLRRKQVLAFEKSSDALEKKDYDFNQTKHLAIDKSDEISGIMIKPSGQMNPNVMQNPPSTSPFNPMAAMPPYDNRSHVMPRPCFSQPMVMQGPSMPFPPMNGGMGFGHPMGRQGPVKDVKSIIADYRQRHPESTPRRGRRMKSALNPMMSPRPIAPKMDSLANLGMIFSNLDASQKAMLERLAASQGAGAGVGAGMPNGVSFKDVLMQYASLQHGPPAPLPRPQHPQHPQHPAHHHHHPPHQADNRGMESKERERERLPPPPYPEISLLPVTAAQSESQHSASTSLLHGILTKNCGEITITPVQPVAAKEPPPERQERALERQERALDRQERALDRQERALDRQEKPIQQPSKEKEEDVVQLDEEDSAGSDGGSGGEDGSERRLVIDEGGGAGGGAAGGAGGGGGGGVPACQGCRRRDAQFVCAGCANQWYCSRECQVAAWDEHSEMCSG